jgi:transcriptional regulator with XRE-family HTH domain
VNVIASEAESGELAREFGQRLAAERRRLGLSPSAFAQASGVSPNSVQGYEAGIGNPSLAYLDRLHVLGCDVYFIVTGQRQVPGLGARRGTSELHERLAEERKRLGLSQKAMASLGGVALSVQSLYESQDAEKRTSPRLTYVRRAVAAGADLMFLVAGVRMNDGAPSGPPSPTELGAFFTRVYRLGEDETPLSREERHRLLCVLTAALDAVASGQAALGALTSSLSSAQEEARVEPAITEAVFEAVSGAAGGSTRVFRLAAGALSAAARAQAEPDVATAAILQAVRRLTR